MDLAALRSFLGWASVLNFLFLSLWFLLFSGAGGFLFRLHSRWFNLTRETFNAIHYAGMAACKIATWMFFFIPYLILRFLLQ